MGFGTLLIGYVLLLNMVQPAVSDVFAGCVLLLALIKLSGVNRHFVRAKWLSLAFSIVGLFELPMFLLGMVIPGVKSFYSLINPYIMPLRYLLLAALTLFLLLGIETVAKEVELERVPRWARLLAVFNIGVRLIFGVCYLPLPLPSLVYVFVFILEFVLTAGILFVIWRCYMMICMPEDLEGKKQKPSRFAFVNAYRERQAEKEREMQEYRLEKMKKRIHKKGKKKK